MLVCLLSLILYSFKYFSHYFMLPRIYDKLRKTFFYFKITRFFFLQSLLYFWINLFALLSLVHLEFIIRHTEFILKCIANCPDSLVNNLLSMSGWNFPSYYFSFNYFLFALFKYLLFHTYFRSICCVPRYS